MFNEYEDRQNEFAIDKNKEPLKVGDSIIFDIILFKGEPKGTAYDVQAKNGDLIVTSKEGVMACVHEIHQWHIEKVILN